MKPPKYMVIINREGANEVLPFDNLEDAYRFYKSPVTEQWSECFLVVVMEGPVV